MIANVREEMTKQIGLSNWMDDETKTLAKEKLDAMSIYIGFPDWYKNETSVLNSYKGVRYLIVEIFGLKCYNQN